MRMGGAIKPSTVWFSGWVIAALSLTVAAPHSRGSDNSGVGEVPPLLATLETTRLSGVPTVLIVTSRANPDSIRLWEMFRASAWVRDHRDEVQVTSVCQETEPQLVGLLKVRSFPTVVVYSSKNNQLAVHAVTTDCRDGAALVGWLEKVGGQIHTTPADPAVQRASFGGHAQASSQGMSIPSAQQPVSTPAQYTPAAVVPTYSQPVATTTASVLQVPSQNFVIQQAPPQIFMAPSQAPVVYVPQTSSGASLASVPSMAPAANNIYFPSGTSAPASLPAAVSAPAAVAVPSGLAMVPSAGLAAAPTGLAAVPTTGLAAVPASGLAVASGAPSALVTNQNISLAASNVQQEVQVRSGGPFRQSARALGRFFTRVGGQPEIVSTQRTSLAPQNVSLGAGQTNISTTSATLAGAPQGMTMLAAPQQPVTVPTQEATRPSPQDGSHHHHRLFHKHDE